LPVRPADPLGLQVQNLCDVVRGDAAPVVSGREGLKALEVIAAVKQAAVSGSLIRIVAEYNGAHAGRSSLNLQMARARSGRPHGSFIGRRNSS
jgi:hypothetical protein